jgi:hypothetical protein
MDYLRYCYVCGIERHSYAECRAPLIKETWANIFRLANLYSDDAIHEIEYIREFLEMEIDIYLIAAIGVQYAGSNENDSVEDHITHILDRINVEIDILCHMSFEMRAQYLHQHYPEIFHDIPQIIPQDIELIPNEERIQQRSIMVEIVYSFIPEERERIIECPICFEDKNWLCINTTNCKHDFCHYCLSLHMTTKMTCPLCRTNINRVQVKSLDEQSGIQNACSVFYYNVDNDSDYDDLPELIDDTESDITENSLHRPIELIRENLLLLTNERLIPYSSEEQEN